MRNRAVIAMFAVLALIATVPASAGTVATIDPVKTTDKTEMLPAASTTMAHTYFAWSQGSAKGGPAHVRLDTDGSGALRIDTGDYGWVGGFAEGDPRLIYQRALIGGRPPRSDLKFYDAELGTRSDAPGGINTRVWQWAPSYDTDGSDMLWILYGENRFARHGSSWRIKLWDEVSGVRRTLAETRGRCYCLFPGSIAFPFASWTKGDPGDAHLYDLQTDVATRLELPGDRDERAVTVTSDGTAYVAQDGARCGHRPKLYRVAPDGTPTLLALLPEGVQVDDLSTFDTGSGIDLYFDEAACGEYMYDIYALRGADTATGLLRAERVGSGGAATVGPRGRLLPPGALPPR